jgi:hypothetical protein
MFNWLREERNRSESIHNRSIGQDIDQAEQNPHFHIPFADHTDRRPDPPEINGRVPDEIRESELTGELTVVEKETHPDTHAPENRTRTSGLARIGWDLTSTSTSSTRTTAGSDGGVVLSSPRQV